MNKQLLTLLFTLFLLSVRSLTAQDFDFSTMQTGTVTDNEGNVYSTVLIGDTWWMAENLRTKHYNDGTEILRMTELMDDSDPKNDWSWWGGVGRWGYPNFDEANIETYGLLYSWDALVNTDHDGVCPDGWSLADTTDWFNLAREIVGENKILYDFGTRPTPTGGTEEYYEAYQVNNLARFLKSDNGVLWTFEPTISTSCNQAQMNVVPSGGIGTTLDGFHRQAEFWTPNYVHADSSGQGRRYMFFSYEDHNVQLSRNHRARLRCGRCTKKAEGIPSGISTVDGNNSGLRVWPNPASDYITIYNPQKLPWKLFTINGVVLKEGISAGLKESISLYDCPDGIYILQVGTSTQKVIKQ